jgi:alginate O-acetyltransferase complex protein AlgI
LFGYNLPTNFLFPYISESFSEFWTRWHMSLSSWLRDYLYFPLGGNRKGKLRTYLNLMIVMGLGGMWHGAAWSYGIWGLWHGAALAIERMVVGPRSAAAGSIAVRVLRGALVFAVVTAGWLLFKLPHFGDVIAYLRTLFTNLHAESNKPMDMMILIYAIPVVAYHLNYLFTRHARGLGRPYYLDGWARHVALGILAAAIVLNPGPSKAFIYFQF